jgi:pilus assembly protein Flp/PilA
MNYITSLVAAFLTKLRQNEEGVTAIEYGLIAGAIAVAIVAVLLAVGDSVENMFQTTSDGLNNVAAGS